jgi:sugar phosphate isomerase/epimerase
VKQSYANLLDQVQVSVPFRQLVDRYLDLFIQYGINPEIGFDSAALAAWNEEAMRDVAQLMAGQGKTITLHGPFMDLAPGSTDERVRELSFHRLEQTMDLVPFLKPKSVVFHAGYDDRRYRGLRQKWLTKSLLTWGPISRRAEELGIMIHLENVYEQTPEMILVLLETISSENIGFCLDLGHMNAFSDAPLIDWLEALGPYLKEVHLHDNDGQGDVHGPIGSGKVPFEQLFQYLTNVGNRPLITLEPHEEDSLWKSLENLEKLWPWQEWTGANKSSQ